MPPKTFTKEDLSSPDVVNFDAVLRIRDLSGFFDPHHRRLSALLSVVANTEARLMYFAMEPEVLIVVRKPLYCKSRDALYDKRFQILFNIELARVALLLDKLALMIDPKAVLEMDFVPIDYLVGKNLYQYDMIREDIRSWVGENESPMVLSKFIPQELNRKIDAYLDMVIPPKNQMLGTCHWIWGMKKTILRYGFNLDWKSPREMNPGVLFD